MYNYTIDFSSLVQRERHHVSNSRLHSRVEERRNLQKKDEILRTSISNFLQPVSLKLITSCVRAGQVKQLTEMIS